MNDSFPNVAFTTMNMLIEERATAKDVVCGCFAFRSVQMSQIAHFDDTEFVNKLFEALIRFKDVVNDLETQGWDLESSRELLGDKKELRVQFS